MRTIPAIDIMGGKCVRLIKGKKENILEYTNTPLELAKEYSEKGATILHVVDLDGAFTGEMKNIKIIQELAKKFPIQVGGGVRSEERIKELLGIGVKKVVVSTILFKDPKKASALKKKYYGKLIGSFDFKQEKLSYAGWNKQSSMQFEKAAKGLQEIIVTDVERDGTLEGPNLELLQKIRKQVRCKVIAAGGVRNLEDVEALQKIGIDGAIIGRAILENKELLNQIFKSQTARNTLSKRIIPCLDVKNGRTVKGTKFENLKDAGDPVELARAYYEQGADEIVFLDITASNEKRKTMVEVAEKVAKEIFIPFTVGGGIGSLKDIQELLRAGADKVSINTSAIENPSLIKESSKEFGSQAIVIAIDAKKEGKKWRVYKNGGKIPTKLNAITWAKKAVSLGAGEILLTSMDRDGTKEGFNIELVNAICNVVNVPVIASGGAGSRKDFLEAFRKTKVSAALAAGIFHYGKLTIPKLKRYLKENKVSIREN